MDNMLAYANAISSAFAAVGTISAVVVSLCLASKSSRQKLILSITFGCTRHKDDGSIKGFLVYDKPVSLNEQGLYVMHLSISNASPVPAKISSITINHTNNKESFLLDGRLSITEGYEGKRLLMGDTIGYAIPIHLIMSDERLAMFLGNASRSIFPVTIQVRTSMGEVFCKKLPRRFLSLFKTANGFQ